MVCDVSRADCYAPAIRPVYVRIADDEYAAGDGNNCGRFSVPMYAARGAAVNCHEHYNDHLVNISFTQGRSNLCSVWHEQNDIKLFIHGDDYVASELDESLKWMAGGISKPYECMTQVLGFESECEM